MFFERLEKACFDKKISVSRLLRELGFSSSSVTYWRRGSMPKINKIVKMSEYLGVSIDYLIEGETHGSPHNASEKTSDTNRDSGDVAEKNYIPYSDDNEKPRLIDRELGRLEGKIEELEKQNAEYKKMIEHRDNQLRNVMERVIEHLEKNRNGNNGGEPCH